MKLLIVEDEMIIAGMLGDMQTGRGYEMIGIAGTVHRGFFILITLEVSRELVQ